MQVITCIRCHALCDAACDTCPVCGHSPHIREREVPRTPGPETTGELIALFRGLRRWTQQRLADELGVHQTTVARWETDRQEIGIANLVRLARALKCEVGDLVPESREK